MTRKEALLFVGKCLSLSLHPERAAVIQKYIKTNQVNWDLVVSQVSKQFMLPAFYLNLKQNNLLAYLPEDLVDYLDEITSLNRARNQSFLNQLANLTTLLRANGLEPVFLKGAAHLLDGLYEDIAERMIGDIDFLLEEGDVYKAYQLLIEKGYSRVGSIGDAEIGEGKHMPRLVKKDEIAAVEIHARMIISKYAEPFGWNHVRNNIKKSKSSIGAFVLSDKDLILHNMMNVQLNDKAKAMFRIVLRQSYDLMLLSKRKNPLEISKSFGHYFDYLNTYIALSAELLDFPKTLVFERNESTDRYIRKIHFMWNNPKLSKFVSRIYFIISRIYRYIKSIILFFIDRQTRRRLISSLSNPTYYRAHFEQYKKW